MDNWYTVLELAFDPPVEDEALIEARIEEKRKFWSVHFNDFKMGAQYRAWCQNIGRIRRDMIGPGNIRAQLAEEARKSAYEDIDKRLRVIGRKGNVSEAEGTRLTKRYNVPLETIESRAKQLGIEWVQGSNTDYQKLYEQYYQTKPGNMAVWENMDQLLAVFEVDNLYDFLFRDTDIPAEARQDIPCGLLAERAKDLRETEFCKTDSLSGTGTRLCSQCEIIFKNAESKSRYDAWLAYRRRKAILDELRDTAADLENVVSEEITDLFVRKLTQVLKDPALAREVLTAFCTVERISFKLGADNSRSRKVCRCGCVNDVSDGRKICSSCGLELTIRCPNPDCGLENDANTKVCRCGFRFENIDKAMALYRQAEQAIDCLNFDRAEAQLKSADQYWPGSERADELWEKLEKYRAQAWDTMEALRCAVRERRYAGAMALYRDLESMFPDYRDDACLSEIEQALETAGSLLRQAQKAPGEAESVALCIRINEICADCPGVRELLMKYPIPPAQNLQIKADAAARMNRITWQGGSDDQSVRYVLVRSDRGRVSLKTDGRQIYTGAARSFCDEDILPGTVYYYNVFAERAGITASGAESDLGGVVNLFEISGLTAASGDGSLCLSWDAPANAAAEIYKISLEDGAQSHFASAAPGVNTYRITGLENDAEYCFRVALSYMVGGRQRDTKGMSVSAVPTCPPSPVDTLRIVSLAADTCAAIWEQPEQGEVFLYCADSKDAYRRGDMIPLEELEKALEPLNGTPLSGDDLDRLAPGERGVSFCCGSDGPQYLIPAAVKAQCAVIGTPVRAARAKAGSIRAIRAVNGKIHVYVDLPRDASGGLLLHRYDRFPEKPFEQDGHPVAFGMGSNRENDPVVVDDLSAGRFYFSVFARYGDGAEAEYAAASHYLFDNSPKRVITYSIATTGGLFSRRAVVLDFEADIDRFTLPDIDIMYAVGNAPVFKHAARLFHAIPAREVEGSCRVKIPLPDTIVKNTHIKAFLRNESDRDTYQLRLKLKSVHKIT